MRWHTLRAGTLTCLAAAVVLLALDLPNDLRGLEPAAFLRLPLEALVYVALVLALPQRLARVRTVLALVGGLLLGVTAVFKGLDMGFLASFDRPFDPLVDWRYAHPLVSLARASFGDRLGTMLLVAAGSTAVLLLVLVPMSVLRVTKVAARHRGSTAGALAVVATLWIALALTGVRTSGGAVAAHDNAPYIYDQITRIPPELRDQRRFTAAAQAEPAPASPGLLSGLRGKNVLFVFVESYGKVALDGSWFSPGVGAVLDKASQNLRAAGFASRSAWFTSPTFGGISWLAHSTLQSGLWVDSQQRYDILLESPRMTLSRYFGEAGWRTVDVVPANDRDWPEGRYYGYDHVYDSRNIGYEGPRFGYPTMPDQFTLAAFGRLELAPSRRRPVMAEIDLLNSHAPWSRTPRMVKQSTVGDGSVFDGMPATLPSETDIWPSPRRVQEAYGHSIEYSLTALTRFITTSLDDDTVVVFLGDHQPSAIVSGEDASHQVPVTIVAKDHDVLDAISSWRWTEGLRPTAGSPVWRMDEFRDRFLAAYEGRAR